LRFRIDALAIEPREDGGGGGSVETSIVKTDSNFQRDLPVPAGLQKTLPRRGKSIKMDARGALVNRQRELDAPQAFYYAIRMTTCLDVAVAEAKPLQDFPKMLSAISAATGRRNFSP
jgi:hypothetical protein